MRLVHVFMVFMVSSFMISCSSNVHFSFEGEEEYYVMNSILTPLSDTIWLELTKSRSISMEKEFVNIDDADIVIEDNGVLLGKFQSLSNGNYFFVHEVQKFHEYSIFAYINDAVLEGSTVVPDLPEFNIEKSDSLKNNFRADFFLNYINKNVWINAKRLASEGGITGDIKEGCIREMYSNSIFLCDFNRSVFFNDKYSFLYDYYLHFNIHEIQQDRLKIDFGLAGMHPNSEIIVSAMDDNLSNYIKSSIMAINVDMTIEEIPINYMPVQNFSNIEGGLGLIGSLNSKSMYFISK